MKTNPGGNISPENVVGRDQMINSLWKTLANQSILLVAERRIGKTTIIKKMEVESPKNTVVIVRDVGGISNAIEFVERVTQDVENYLSKSQKTARRLKSAIESLSGTEFKMLGIKFPDIAASHWKTLLEKVLADFAEENSQQAILIWDEMPWMLQKIKKTAGETEAMDVLDILRGLRQTYNNLRMVYTGSIGLHHVITALREEGYVNSPLNDMRTVDVPPLDNPHAKELAQKLIQGEELKSDRLDETTSKIAELVDSVPYYIHHIVAAMVDCNCIASPENAEKMVKQALVDSQDPWNLEHYRSRLSEYYAEKAELVLAVLDQLSETQPLTRNQLREEIKNSDRLASDKLRTIVEYDTEDFRKLLKLMQRDHYLMQDVDTGSYRFRFDLIRRWWRLDRGLL